MKKYIFFSVVFTLFFCIANLFCQKPKVININNENIDRILNGEKERLNLDNINYFTINYNVDSLSSIKSTFNLDKYYYNLPSENNSINIDGNLYYVVEGDILLDRDEFAIYGLTKDIVNSLLPDSSNNFLTSYSTNNQIAKWPTKEIKYCFNYSTFGNDEMYNQAVFNFRRAADDWEKICDIKFIYIPAADKKNYPPYFVPEEVDFIIRQTNMLGKAFMRAFYPTDPKSEHKVHIDPAYFTYCCHDRVGVFRHEIGHILGYMHEQVGLRNCKFSENLPSDVKKEQATPFDKKSVMYYCEDTCYAFKFSINDIKGVQEKYGAAKAR